MNAKKYVKTLVCISLLGVSAAAVADYVGPSTYSVFRSVAEVIKNGKDEDAVLLKGNIVKRIGKEKLVFRDTTGEIHLDVDQEKMPAQNFDDKTVVEVGGEVEKGMMRSPEIDVKSIRIVK
jgi:uncharacterized protein (TIGR00156 family)